MRTLQSKLRTAAAVGSGSGSGIGLGGGDIIRGGGGSGGIIGGGSGGDEGGDEGGDADSGRARGAHGGGYGLNRPISAPDLSIHKPTIRVHKPMMQLSNAAKRAAKPYDPVTSAAVIFDKLLTPAKVHALALTRT